MNVQDDITPGFWSQLHEDWEANGKDWTAPGFRAVAVYRLGAHLPKLRNKLIRVVLSRIHLTLYRFIRNVYGIELPNSTQVGRRFRIVHQSGIVIHPYAEIGDDCTVRQNVTIGAAYRFHEAPKLGNNVHVGAGAVIIGKVTVGDNTKISPNVVVLNNIPPNSAVFENPPRIIQLPEAAAPQTEQSPEKATLPVGNA